ACAGSLTGCGSKTQTTAMQTLADEATRWTQLLSWNLNGVSSVRGSALLGVYLSQHLLREVVFGSALAGVTAQAQLFSQTNQEQDQSFALLETLGSILQVDVPDMLNRSTDRSAAFDTYLSSLQNLTQQGQAQLTALQQKITDLTTQRRTLNTQASKTQRDLNTAIRTGNYAGTSELQKNLIDQKGQIA